MPLDPEQQLAQQTVATNLLEIIGQGIDFPLSFTNSRQVGTIQQSNAGERINDSIHLILATRIGERLMNPEFGSRLPELVFEPNDAVLQRLLVFYTAEALKRWEKRIEVLRVVVLNDIDDDRNQIGVQIEYTIRNTHMRGSYVYPFVREAMPTGDLYTGIEAHRMRTAGTVVE
jgi:phage baseplate assembly protein W